MNVMNPTPQAVAGGQTGNYRKDWIFAQLTELGKWSKTDHEQKFCADAYYYYKHFKNYVDKRVQPDDYRSNIGVGIAYPTVEIVHARVMEPWLSGDYLVSATAEDLPGQDVEERVQAFVNNVMLNRVRHSYAKHSMMCKSALIVGRGVMKPHVRYVRPMSLLKRIASQIAGIRLGSSVQREDQPATRRLDFDYVDAFDWWKTPGARLLADADWTFENGYLTTAQAHALQESGAFDPAVEIESTDALGHDEYQLKRNSLETGVMGQVQSGMSGVQFPPHRFLEFQGRLDVRDDPAQSSRYEDLHVIILDEKHIVLEEELKTWNNRPGYLEWAPTLDPFSEKPIGMIEPIEDILLEINDYENIALDNARKILESPLLVDPNSTKQDKLYLGPAEINWVKNPRGSVAPLEMKDLPRSFYHQIGYLNDLVQRISGVSDYFGGLNTGDTDRLTQTATGMTLMANLASSRFGPMLASLDRDYYREAARWIHETAKLWMTEPENVRLPANPSSPFTSVGPDDLDQVLTFNFNTKALDPSSERRRGEFVKLAEMLSGIGEQLAMGGYMIDFYELARILMDEFDRGGETNHIIKPIPTPEGMPEMPPGPPGAGPPVPPGVNPMEAVYPGPTGPPPPQQGGPPA